MFGRSYGPAFCLPPPLFQKRKSLHVTKIAFSLAGIVGFLRPGGGRGKEIFGELIRRLGDARADIVVKDADVSEAGNDVELRATFVNATIVAGEGKGFVRPEAGEDRQWLRENMLAFRWLAEEGDEEMRLLVQEVEDRKLI